ncbi:zinc ribbon domain-containing protein [Candidatus Bathyarchaeota archaeon]|nr:MAG: zinc ribbon domain-containing protein [Candidatus Bathyarchaeota archaeon]
MWGVIIIILSLISFATSSLGGFFIGFLLGLIGGILGIVYKPAMAAGAMQPPPMMSSMPMGSAPMGSMGMNCKNCGASIPAGATRCPSCGASV